VNNEWPPLWQILIATLSRRQRKFLNLLDVLLPQCEKAGDVHVLACSNDGEEGIGAIRDRLLQAAEGQYVSFLDDDDTVTDDFVLAIRWALRIDPPPDVVGFNVTYSSMGVPGPSSILSINNEPHDTPAAMYRDLTHVQPIRRELAREGSFARGWPEDSTWRGQVRPLVKDEIYIDKPLYSYRHDPRDSVQYGVQPSLWNVDEQRWYEPQPRWPVESLNFAYLGWPSSTAGTTASERARPAHDH
jgi:hypothetical protein